MDAREASLSQIFAAGVAAHRAGDLATARGAYERVLATDPNHVDALNNMGVLLSSTREFDRAETLLRRAVSLSPRNAGAWNNLGTALAQRGQASNAIAAFQHALGIDPLHPSARVSLAQQYLAVGALKESRALLEAVLASDASVAEAHYALGQVLELERDWAGAIRSYNAFVRTAPGRLAGHVEHVRRRVEALSERVR
ncbi:MAG: tetratricopeptide repeat protein [Gemmatimonadaceae bacterium]